MKKSNLFAFGTIAIVIIVVLGFFMTKESSNNQQSADSSKLQQDTSSEQNSDVLSPDTYSKEVVAKHNTISDCWTIIEGNVYDLTAYVQIHSGGDEILRACGIDGTTLFKERKTAEGDDVGTGTPHSSTAETELKTLLIGTVSN